MSDETTTTTGLRTFATIDSVGGKVSKRVEVLPVEPPATPDGRYDGMLVVRGEHPTGAIDPRAESSPPDDLPLQRGALTVGYAPASSLRDWYAPDRIVVPGGDGPAPGTYAETRTRGRVRIDGLEAHIAPDGRPAFRALVRSGTTGSDVVDQALPREDVLRLVTVRPSTQELPDASAGGSTLELLSVPVLPVLPPGRYPDRSRDVRGLPPRDDAAALVVRAFWLEAGTRVEVVRVDEQAFTAWIVRTPGSDPVPVSIGAVQADLVRYDTTPA